MQLDLFDWRPSAARAGPDYRVPDGRRATFDRIAQDILEHEAMVVGTAEPRIEDALLERTALELIRHRLSRAEAAYIDRVDAFWRTWPMEFNEAYRWCLRSRRKRDDRWPTIFPPRGLEDVILLDGQPPMVPKAHWWWFFQDVPGARRWGRRRAA